MPFAIDLTSPPRNYDSGGMSIAGAKPALGHLGVILYGEAAVNDALGTYFEENPPVARKIIGKAIDASRPMIATTIISSIKVKPWCCRLSIDILTCGLPLVLCRFLRIKKTPA